MLAYILANKAMVLGWVLFAINELRALIPAFKTAGWLELLANVLSSFGAKDPTQK